MRWLLAIGLALLVAATAGAKAPQWFPLQVGDHWSWTFKRTIAVNGLQTQSQTVKGTLDQDIRQITKTRGQQAFEKVTSMQFESGPKAHAERIALEGLTAQGVVVVGHQDPPAPMNFYDPPLLILKLPAVEKDHWTAGIEHLDRLQADLAGQTEGFETVSVEAGQFRCLKVTLSGKVTGTYAFMAHDCSVDEGSMLQTTWLADGVGSVQHVATLRLAFKIHGEAASVVDSQMVRLKSYKLK